jgi:hypothetical protein
MLLLSTAILALSAAQYAVDGVAQSVEVHSLASWGDAPTLLSSSEMSDADWGKYFDPSLRADWLELVFDSPPPQPYDDARTLFLTNGSVLIGGPATPSAEHRFAWRLPGGQVVEVDSVYVKSVTGYAQSHSSVAQGRDLLHWQSSSSTPDVVRGWFLRSDESEVVFETAHKEAAFPWAGVTRIDLLSDDDLTSSTFFVHFKQGVRLAVDSISLSPKTGGGFGESTWAFASKTGAVIRAPLSSVALIEQRPSQNIMPQSPSLGLVAGLGEVRDTQPFELWKPRENQSAEGRPLAPAKWPVSRGIGLHSPTSASFVGWADRGKLFLRIGRASIPQGVAALPDVEVLIQSDAPISAISLGLLPKEASLRVSVDLPAGPFRILLQNKSQSWAGAQVDVGFLGWIKLND